MTLAVLQHDLRTVHSWRVLSLGVALVCFVSVKLTVVVLKLGLEASPVWTPAGIALAALLLFGWRMWTGVALGMFLAALSLEASWVVAGVAASGNTLGAIAGKVLLDRMGFQSSLRRLRDVLGFAALAVVSSPVVNATISTLNACAAGLNPWSEFGSHWGTVWLGDGTGILVITPLLLTWLGKPYPNKPPLRSVMTLWQRDRESRQKLVEALLWLLLLLVTSWIVFCSDTQTEIVHYPLEYVTFPLIIWAALRFGQRGTVLGGLIISTIAIGGAVQASGPFVAKSGGDVRQAVFLLQAFVGIVTMTALVMAAAVAERQQAEDCLRKSESSLLNAQRIAQLGNWDLTIPCGGYTTIVSPCGMLRWSDELYRILGFAPQGFTPSFEIFLRAIHPDDRDSLQQALQQAVIQRVPYRLNYRVVLPDGSERLVNEQVEIGLKSITGTVQDVTAQKQAESALRQSEEQSRVYADIVKNMQMGLIVWQMQDLNDLNTFQLVNINPAARRILQITVAPKELIGQRMVDLFPCLLKTTFPQIYADVIRSGKVKDLSEVRYQDETLSEGVYATKVFPLPDRCVGLVFEDITDRKQAEIALQQSESRFRIVAETAACAFLVYQGSHLRYVNPAAEAITEYSQADLLEMNFWEVAHPDFQPLVQQRGLARQQGEAVPTRYEIKIVTRSGKERWVDFTAGSIYFEGQPAALGTAYDITDRKQAEARLRFAAERERLLAEIARRIRRSLNLEEILNTTVAEIRQFLRADRVFICRIKEAAYIQTVAESVDPKWAQTLGWTVDPDVFQEMKALFDRDATQRSPNANKTRIVNDSSQVENPPVLVDYYHRCQTKAGMSVALMLEGDMFGVLVANQCSGPREWKPFEIDLFEQLATQVELAIQQGQLYRQVQTLAANLEFQVEERTAELQQRMDELCHSNQVKDLLLHAVSHDLRTPVQGMLMVLNKLRKKCCNQVPVSDSVLDLMIHSCDHQLHLLSSLREDHAADDVQNALNLVLVDVSTIAAAALEKLKYLLTQNQATVINQFPPGLPPIKANAVQLEQVFKNLLSNAVKHNPPGQTITLNAAVVQAVDLGSLPDASSTQILCCTIEDTGRGMSQAQCDRLFQLYVRGLDNHHLTGIGLGLHRCHQIITAHGGQIGVTSRPTAGSKFWFSLPIL